MLCGLFCFDRGPCLPTFAISPRSGAKHEHDTNAKRVKTEEEYSGDEQEPNSPDLTVTQKEPPEFILARLPPFNRGQR